MGLAKVIAAMQSNNPSTMARKQPKNTKQKVGFFADTMEEEPLVMNTESPAFGFKTDNEVRHLLPPGTRAGALMTSHELELLLYIMDENKKTWELFSAKEREENPTTACEEFLAKLHGWVEEVKT